MRPPGGSPMPWSTNERAGRIFGQPRSPPSGRELTPRSAEMRPVRLGPRPKDQGKNQHTAWNFAPSWAANVSASPRHSLFFLITAWQRIQSSPEAAHTHTRACTHTLTRYANVMQNKWRKAEQTGFWKTWPSIYLNLKFCSFLSYKNESKFP